MLTILVLCTGNSCRSIMAEALLNHHAKDKVKACSAGSFPTGTMHPLSLATLKVHGFSTEGYRSKSWEKFTTGQPIDMVITVCDAAAGESCPLFPGMPVEAHWGVPDPAHFQGTDAEKQTEFNRVFEVLEKRVKAFAALTLDSMDKAALADALQEIGTL